MVGQMARQISDVEVPAVSSEEVHQAQSPEIRTGQKSSPWDIPVGRFGPVAVAANQIEFGLIDLGLFFGAVAEPQPEDATPYNANQSKNPKGMSPVRDALAFDSLHFKQEGRDNERRKTTA